MPLLYIVAIVVSIPLIIHCIRTGRNTIWVFVMLSLPLIGSAAYFFVEIFPELRSSRASRRAMRGLRNTLDPEGSLRRAENEMKVSGNVASRQKYADELVRMGRAAEAVPIYKNCLTGLFADDPKLLLGFAHAQFAAGEPAAARQTLDELIARNPEFRSPDGHLLYARALEGEGNDEKALAEYATLADYYPGAEAGVRYASCSGGWARARWHARRCRRCWKGPAWRRPTIARPSASGWTRLQANYVLNASG